MKKTTVKGETFIKTEHAFEGLENGSQRFAKVQLALKIKKEIKERKLTQKKAGELLGLTQPQVSALTRGKLSDFTFDRLYKCLAALKMDIEITVKRHDVDDYPAGITVCVA